MNLHPRSFQVYFNKKDFNNIKLTEVVAAISIPPASSDTTERKGITGFWIQLETDDSRVLHRQDIPYLMHCLSHGGSSEEVDEFFVWIPYMTQAKKIVIFGPPREADGVLPGLGAESVLIGTFALPLDYTDYENQAKTKTKFDETTQYSKRSLDTTMSSSVILPNDIVGSGKGSVLKVNTMLYHGRIDNINNLVILADSFGAQEQEEFIRIAAEAVDYTLSKLPFNSVLGSDAVNVFLVEVASNPGETYFDINANSTRLNQSSVNKVCNTLFSNNGKPYWNWAGVLTNNSKVDGFAYTSQGLFVWGLGYASLAAKVFQHELGHAAFGLGDEYGLEKERYTGAEPHNPNLTIETSSGSIKWRDFITPGVPIPTISNPSCLTYRGANPVSHSSVGLYAGGGAVYNCGIFHPQYYCTMGATTIISDIDFCKVCSYEASKMLARAVSFLVPAPGSIFYSPISESWSHSLITPNIIDNYGRLQNFAQHDAVITELLGGTVGTNVINAFNSVSKNLPADLEVMQAYYDAGISEGVWYLISKSTRITYYIHSFKIAIHSELGLGKIALPDFPTLTLFDAVVVGTQVNLFAVNNRILTYGKLDDTGNIIGGELAFQNVKGLNNDISNLSVNYIKSRIWVAVVDGLDIRIAGYELLNGAWWAEGFIRMPTSASTDFESVRIQQVDTDIHILANTGQGLLYNKFDTISKSWVGNAIATPITNSIYYDLTFDEVSENLCVITNSGSTTSYYTYNTSSNTWSSKKDITASLGMPSTSVISSLGCAIINTKLYVVALVDQLPQYAVFDVKGDAWDQILTEIKPLDSLSSTIGTMTVHATSSQLYIGLSSGVNVGQ